MFLIMVIYMKMSICNHLNTNQSFPADRVRVTPRGATRATSSAIEPASLSLHSSRCHRRRPSSLARGGLRLERRGALDGVLLVAEQARRGGGPGSLRRFDARGGCADSTAAGTVASPPRALLAGQI
jgi:hypothetical protein